MSSEQRQNKYKPLTSASCNFTQLGVVFWKEVKNGIVHALEAIPVLLYILFADNLHTLHPQIFMKITYSTEQLYNVTDRLALDTAVRP